MEPIHIGNATLYQGDALDAMSSLPRVDALITDPPYCSGAFTETARRTAHGQGLRSANMVAWFYGDNMGTAGLMFLLRTMAFRAVDILSPEGSLLIFTDWRMVPNIAPAIESVGLRYQNMICWDKGSIGLGTGFRPQHEIILQFTTGTPKYHDCSTGNIVRAKRVSTTEREHQAQKPIELMRKLIRVVTPPGGIVLDPFCGSGSTGVAALDEGRRFIGIDRDPRHIATAAARLREAQSQADMFAEESICNGHA